MSLSHRPATRAVRRLLATTTASAMVIALGPLVGPAAAQVAPRGVDTVCPPPGQEQLQDAFTDDEASVHERSINCAAAYDIALGVTSTQYQPQLNTKRDQMASFIARLIRTAGQNLPDNPPDAFTDDEQSVHENNINALAAANVVLGVTSTQYNPNAPVKRDQMASFINRAIDYVDDGQVNGSLPPDTTNDFFTDDEQSVHEQNINELAEQGIVAGRGNQQFDPDDFVDRAAMATFLMQAADFLAERGLWAPFGDVTITGLQEGAELRQGEQVTVTVAAEGETITQVRVLGCGVDETVATDADATTAGFQVQFTIPAGQTAGECTLRFIVTTADGDTLERRITVTITAAPALPGNQDFFVNPDEDATLRLTEQRQFSATAIQVETVDIRLFPCDNVTVAEDGTVTFVDTNPDDAVADPGTVTDADIVSVDGVIISGQQAHVDDVIVGDDNEVIFTISASAATCVQPVVFDDPDDDQQVDLDANNQPTEEFGVGGETTFVNVAALTLNAEPEFDVNQFGVQHTVVAELENAQGDPVSLQGEQVTFQLIRTDIDRATEPADGIIQSECEPGEVISVQTVPLTDGSASFTFTEQDPAPNTAGNEVDRCVRAFLDLDDDQAADANEVDFVAKVFSDEPPQVATLEVRPEQDTNLVNTSHSVTAVVTDQFGNPANVTVTFQVFRDEDTTGTSFTEVIQSQQTTGTDGAATLTYVGPNSTADDVIVACVDDDDTGTDCNVTFPGGAVTIADSPNDTSLKFWTEVPTTITTVTDADVRGFDKTQDFVAVEQADDKNYRLPYDSGDQFFVDGTPVNIDQFEAALTLDDTLTAVFRPGGVSEFRLDNAGAPVALDADYNDAAGGTADTFGDEVGDQVIIDFDETMVVGTGATVTIDPDGAGATSATTYTCGTMVSCAASGNSVIVAVTDAAATDTAITLGTSTVTSTSNITDPAGNAPTGYPVVIDAD